LIDFQSNGCALFFSSSSFLFFSSFFEDSCALLREPFHRWVFKGFPRDSRQELAQMDIYMCCSLKYSRSILLRQPNVFSCEKFYSTFNTFRDGIRFMFLLSHPTFFEPKFSLPFWELPLKTGEN